MSHFLCGNIESRETEEIDYTNFLFRVIEAGAKLHLSIQFGVNIKQQIVFDIMRLESGVFHGNSLPFFVTGSPIANTSDEIFYPPSAQFCSEKRTSYLKSKIDDIVSWTGMVFSDRTIVGMSMYFSEGYDTDYDYVKCSLDELAGTLCQILLPIDHVPSTRIELAR